MVRMRLTASGADADAGTDDKILDDLFLALQNHVKEFMVTNKDEPMEKTVGNLLLSEGKTMCTAESCTGGYIAHLLTLLPGASAFYDGSVISYSYSAKEDLLGVQKNTLQAHGAVSEEIVREMALGALNKIGSDYTIAVSGIMGPDGGMPGKPVGTVWVCVGNSKTLITKKFEFRFDRERNIRFAALNALNMLRKFVLENN